MVCHSSPKGRGLYYLNKLLIPKHTLRPYRLHDLNATIIIILAVSFRLWLISLDCFLVVRELQYSVMISSKDIIVLKLSNELFTRANK